MPDGSPWPSISVVTPSYNQGPFLEETIRSVLLQGYPNLEYHVLDGGSSDESVEIIRKYERWLTGWVSRPDDGQAAAVAQGWADSSGRVLAYLNSDDAYLPGAVQRAVAALSGCGGAAVCGGELRVDAAGYVLSEYHQPRTSFRDLLDLRFLPQPAIVLWRSALEAAGGIDCQFRHVFDFELWTRIAERYQIVSIPEAFAISRYHADAKTFSRRAEIAGELQSVIRNLLERPTVAQFTSAERRAIVGRLNFVTGCAYLGDQPQYFATGVARLARAAVVRPSRIPAIARLIVGTVIGRPRKKPLQQHQPDMQARDLPPRGREPLTWHQWRPAAVGITVAAGAGAGTASRSTLSR